jgi:hypothetical protein
MCVIVSLVVVLCVGFVATVGHAFSADENLGAWRRASTSDRQALYRAMLRRVTSGLSESDPDARAGKLRGCIDDVAGDGGPDSLKISEIAGTCFAMSGLHK